jgi:hypothetical protein
MMTDTYTSAKTVIAWLGEEDNFTGLAFELLGALRASLLVQPDSLLLEAKEDEEPFTGHKKSSIEDEELLEGFKEFGMSHRDEPKGRDMQDEKDKPPDAENERRLKLIEQLLGPQINRKALASLLERKRCSRAWVI